MILLRKNKTRFLAFLSKCVLGTLILASTMMPTASAADSAAKSTNQAQVPGYYRFQLGKYQVTALYDGYVRIENKLLSGASAESIQKLLEAMFVDSRNGVQTAVNAYLVNTGTQLILIDTGAASVFGPKTGGMLANLRAAGIDPAQVDAVFVTHLHPDHACGLLDASGKIAFSKALVYVAKPEADFWLAPDRIAQSPEGLRGVVALAQAAVAPYREAGKMKTFSVGDAIIPGIEIISTPGHTPGHTSYLVTSADSSLLVMGDLVHSHATQFAHPEVAIEYDYNKEQAVETRKKIFARAAEQKLWVAGAHLPFPGLGHIRAEKGGGFAWVPVEFSPVE